MPRVTCSKRIEWDAAHRVLRHESKCATIHGHRYAAEIVCEADELDDVGRVIDFGVIKARVGGWIDDNWDHTTLVNQNDAVLMDACMRDARESGRRHPYTFVGEPTAENIALELLCVSRDLLKGSGVRVVRIRVYETPTSYAEAVA